MTAFHCLTMAALSLCVPSARAAESNAFNIAEAGRERVLADSEIELLARDDCATFEYLDHRLRAEVAGGSFPDSGIPVPHEHIPLLAAMVDLAVILRWPDEDWETVFYAAHGYSAYWASMIAFEGQPPDQIRWLYSSEGHHTGMNPILYYYERLSREPGAVAERAAYWVDAAETSEAGLGYAISRLLELSVAEVEMAVMIARARLEDGERGRIRDRRLVMLLAALIIEKGGSVPQQLSPDLLDGGPAAMAHTLGPLEARTESAQKLGCTVAG